jgi:transposase
MATISLDLRTRILAAYDKGDVTRQQAAERFGVSEGMVKKLLHQRRATGDIADRHRYSGNKPRLRSEHGEALRAAVAEQPDLTLAELKSRLKLGCTPQAIHHVLVALELTYKKRRCMRPSRPAPMSRRRAKFGGKRSPG